MTGPGKKRIAVVGGGIAGIAAAWLLQRRYDVHLYERDEQIGGHTRTLDVQDQTGRTVPVDTGFIVMNHRNYPLLTRFFEELNVPLADSNMSFSVHLPEEQLCYAGTSLRSLFASPGSLLKPSHWNMIRDIIRFNRQASQDLDGDLDASETLGDYLDRLNMHPVFRERYLLPMGAAIWSAPQDQMTAFPARAFLHFFHNHGLLNLRDRPQWKYVQGGSRTYVEHFKQGFTGTLHHDCPVQAVKRNGESVSVYTAESQEEYSHVVLAAHADESLCLLEDPSPEETRLLGTWRFQRNEVALHRDTSLMPPRPSAWASWNVCCRNKQNRPVTLTYHMNRLQRLDTDTQYFVSLNQTDEIQPNLLENTTVMTHPVFTTAAMHSQDAIRQLNGNGRTWFCGAWMGYGFHEDGFRSGYEAAEQLGVTW